MSADSPDPTTPVPVNPPPPAGQPGGLARMVGRILSVGGLTLGSRVVGFGRDVMMAAVLGAGPVADAFLVAFRLPNHFRAIFAEGAFNAAFIPAYARVMTQSGMGSARVFGDRIFTLLFISQAVLLFLALVFTSGIVSLVAPGFRDDPQRFGLAVELTEITFPYLMLITMVTLFGGILNALQKFASAAAAPILLNLSMIVTLALAAFFPTAGHAAAWGVFIAGCLQFLLLAADTWRSGAMVMFRRPTLDPETRQFFRALGPAVIGSAGIQIALFADTIIASFLPAGSLSALYYADRLNQLPVGVIGIAAGTVLLPEMARRIAAGDAAGARYYQNRAIEITLLLSLPCVVAFLIVPDVIMKGLFGRGAFTAADAVSAGKTLAAYAIGLLPFVLLRPIVAAFHGRGDTKTPVIASLTAVSVNVALKFMLMGSLAQVGLALATAVGAWVNVGLLVFFGLRQKIMGTDAALSRAAAKLAIAGAAMAIALVFAKPVAVRIGAATPGLGDEVALLIVAAVGAVVYLGLVLAMFGRGWLAMLRRRKSAPASPPPEL
jgi:putative peptidoglycan lipid II flippase